MNKRQRISIIKGKLNTQRWLFSTLKAHSLTPADARCNCAIITQLAACSCIFSAVTPSHVPACLPSKQATIAFSPVLYVPLHAILPESHSTANSGVLKYPMNQPTYHTIQYLSYNKAVKPSQKPGFWIRIKAIQSTVPIRKRRNLLCFRLRRRQ